MPILILIYTLIFLAVGLYVGINIYHMIRFRLGFRGDKTSLVVAVYLILILAILAISWLGAFAAYQPPTS